MDAAIKIADLVSWHTTPVSLCWYNDQQLEILKNIALDFVPVVLKLYPIQVISLPLWIKLTMSQLLLLFMYNFCSLLNYVGGVPIPNLFQCYWFIYFGYLANYSTQRAIVIIFLICCNLLNCLRSAGTLS